MNRPRRSRQRAGPSAGRFELRPGPGRHRPIEDRERVLAGRFCGVHRGIGLGDEIFCRGQRRARQRAAIADRAADDDRSPAEQDRPTQLAEDALGGSDGLVLVARPGAAGPRTRRRSGARRRPRRERRRSSRSATWTRIWSPAAWPNESLTRLKSSRSTKSRATVPGVRSRRASARSRWSRRRTRLATPGQRVVERVVDELGLKPLPVGRVDEQALRDPPAARVSSGIA